MRLAVLTSCCPGRLVSAHSKPGIAIRQAVMIAQKRVIAEAGLERIYFFRVFSGWVRLLTCCSLRIGFLCVALSLELPRGQWLADSAGVRVQQQAVFFPCNEWQGCSVRRQIRDRR